MSQQLLEMGDKSKKVGMMAGNAAKGAFSDFQAFINKGNVVDLAVGLVIGSAFSLVVASLVNDLFTPILSLAGSSNTFGELFVVMRKGLGKSPNGFNYKTRAEAVGDGAITLNWGNFIQALINFLIVALSMFLVIKLARAMIKEEKKASMKPCPQCLESVKEDALKCKWCCSEFESILGVGLVMSPSTATLN
ncbi:large-conductance mechanosensitive channel [Blastocladiella britannica]|nr:large-conductance mechanosensitive channel [Blastocladiella britannica]